MKAWILAKKENFNSYENRRFHEEADKWELKMAVYDVKTAPTTV